MKHFAFLILFVAPLLSYGQDTISQHKRYGGGETFLIKMKKDTFFICTYPSGEVESKRHYTLKNEPTMYYRYYKSGNKLWQREMKQGKANGATFFYNQRGMVVASLVFKNDTLVDTNFIHPNVYFVFGRATYYSIVHGGMQREDGSSNISGGAGTYMFTPMYTVKLDPKKKEQTVYKNFRTDFDGYYFIILEKGNFGFFPEHQALDQITSEMGAPRGRAFGGIEGSWNISAPVQIKDKNLNPLNLHYESVGYAP